MSHCVGSAMDTNFLEKLESEVMRRNLTGCSLFLTAYELLKGQIVDQVRSFYFVGFDPQGDIYSPEFREKVLSLDKDLFSACCQWLVRAKALTDEDVLQIKEIREHRNFVAHRLPEILLEADKQVDTSLLNRCEHFIATLGRFWGGIAADTDPQFDGVEVDYDGIVSGPELIMKLIRSVITEDAT